MRRIPADYDDKTLQFVRWEAQRILTMFKGVLRGYEIYKSSDRNYHVVWQACHHVEREEALYILLHTRCSGDYLDFVEARGITIRVTAKRRAPAPSLLETNLSGGLDGASDLSPTGKWKEKRLRKAGRLRHFGRSWEEVPL